MGYAKMQIIGHLGRDPEMRYTPQNKAVTEFSVAVSQSTKVNGEWVEATDWFRVSVWGAQAETAAEKYKKGSKVLVDGRFRSREYVAGDGTKRISLEITADTVVGLDPKAAPAPTDDPEGPF